MTRELLFLSPYRLPGQNALYLSNEDVACLLNGYLALWHPAAAAAGAGPPRIASPYDHEQPAAGHLYGVPESPPLVLPDDWEERATAEEAPFFRAVADRAATLDNLRAALRSSADAALLDLPDERLAPFFGLGFGYAHLEALFEAMDHQFTLDLDSFWRDVQEAIAHVHDSDPEAFRAPLQRAAERMLAAREVLYPTSIWLLDLHLLTDEALDRPLPPSLAEGLAPVNVLASGSLLERIAQQRPELLELFRQRQQEEMLEVCGGLQVEREEPLLPLESQLWNLRKGQAVTEKVLGRPARVFARRTFGFHPQLPSQLHAADLRRMILLSFDEGVLPSQRSVTINWPSPDGKQVDALTRSPHAGDSPQVWFHAAHHLHQTIMQDQTAALVLSHTAPAGPWYRDWLELSRLAPVLGKWATLSRFFDEIYAGDYVSPPSADEFHADHLNTRVPQEPEATYDDVGNELPPAPVEPRPSHPCPVSGFATHLRARRVVDTAWALTALHRSLGGKATSDEGERQLSELEDRVESAGAITPTPELTRELDEALARAAERLTDRLLAQATGATPGYMVLNPCSFTRRVAVEIEGLTTPPGAVGPVKASQVNGGVAQLLVEVPPLGFAWFPREGGKPQASRVRTADERCVRNEFFEAEVDPNTGGLKSIRDLRTRMGRLGQQLVFNPGSSQRVKSVRTTSAGPALGEIVTEGELLDDAGGVLAGFRQRFRAWMSRPVLDLRIELFPQHRPTGYPWHSYYAARFAWRDERTYLLRGALGIPQLTSQTRPESPDFIEWRLGRENMVLLTGGLPFHQRHGARMLDVLLVPPGETATTFDFAIGLDREYPGQTALGLATPVPVVPTRTGPPHVGASGWLFHLDVPNLMMTSFRPAPGGADGVTARFLECSDHSVAGEFRCVRNPVKAQQIDLYGRPQAELRCEEDIVYLDAMQTEMVQMQVDFSLPEEGQGDSH